MHLFKIGDLKVKSRTSVMQYKGTTKTTPQIAEELGVANVLEGSIFKANDQVRITVQLINAEKDEHIWAESYDRNIKDIFSIQSKVALEIARNLKAEISPIVKERINSVPTENLEAYNLLLQAQYKMLENPISEAGKELAEKAISIDPDFAESYAALAVYWLYRGGFAGDLSSQESLGNALPLLEKALELDQYSLLAHLCLSFVHLWYQCDFEATEKDWVKIFEISPSCTEEYLTSYVFFLITSGRSQTAVKICEDIYGESPVKDFNLIATGLSYYFDNQVKKGIQFCETAYTFSQNIPVVVNDLGRIYLYTGQYQKVISLLSKFLQSTDLQPARTYGNLAIAYYHMGEIEKTKKYLEKLKKRSEQSSVGSPSIYVAMIYTQMGEPDLAFKYLEKARETHEVELYWVKVEPPFEPLHGDPRWQQFLDQVGFPEFEN
jgi:tetratricopeptide (TPR) repeat protein